MRRPTSNPSLASWLRHGLLLAAVAFASSCLNPRPEDDPSATQNADSDPSYSPLPPALPAPGNNGSNISPPLPVGPADPSDPNPNGIEGEVPPPTTSNPPSIDAGLAPDGGPDAGL